MHLRKIEIANFSCLRDVTVEFTDLHALIGPNDSGKSTILRSVRLLTQVLASTVHSENSLSAAPDIGVIGTAGTHLRGWFDSLDFEITIEHPRSGPGLAGLASVKIEAGSPGGQRYSEVKSSTSDLQGFFNRSPSLKNLVFSNPSLSSRIFKCAQLVRLDPDALRRDSELIPDDKSISFFEDSEEGIRGSRLPGIYDAIMNRGDESFAKIREQTRAMFPTVRNVRLRTTSNSRKCLEVELVNGTRVPAAQMSEGLLYFLAYVALPYLAPPSILLVEEPENGLHPSRIRDVMNILREISKTTQVIIATHSPLVVNELNYNEVTVVTREIEKGTQARKLTDAEDFKVRSEEFLPGELWLNYANGVDEENLFQPRKSTP